MRIPGTKKSEKRKASVVSVEDGEKKEGKREKKKARSNQSKGEKKAESATPDAQPQASSPRSPTTPTVMSPDDRVDSVAESPPSTALTHAHTDPTPRRSSRIKNSLHSVAQTWDKARPYIERINGTIMPLEPQAGADVYYKRDGVK